ncbi:hypothetical protein KSF78_0002445 [Schistosoma japonicum]|nr:hypothetical protein KSF78_0002445 [Schistosoma japonicum]
MILAFSGLYVIKDNVVVEQPMDAEAEHLHDECELAYLMQFEETCQSVFKKLYLNDTFVSAF